MPVSVSVTFALEDPADGSLRVIEERIALFDRDEAAAADRLGRSVAAAEPFAEAGGMRLRRRFAGMRCRWFYHERFRTDLPDGIEFARFAFRPVAADAGLSAFGSHGGEEIDVLDAWAAATRSAERTRATNWLAVHMVFASDPGPGDASRLEESVVLFEAAPGVLDRAAAYGRAIEEPGLRFVGIKRVAGCVLPDVGGDRRSAPLDLGPVPAIPDVSCFRPELARYEFIIDEGSPEEFASGARTRVFYFDPDEEWARATQRRPPP